MRFNLYLLLFVSFLYSSTSIDNGDLNYVKQNYIQAIKEYEIAYKNNHPKARIKLIMCYLKLADNFTKTKRYEESLEWYNKAKVLNSKVASNKISKVYEKQADMYLKIKEYQKALFLYEKSLKLGNISVKQKIKKANDGIEHKSKLENDTRKLVTQKSPIWTKSIGRLIIPTKLDFITSKKYKTNFKKCSASVVNFDKYKSSRVIVTASHCLTNYNKKAGDIRFIIKDSKSQMIQRYATVYKDSNYSSKRLKIVSDYAILILDNAISNEDVEPLKISSDSFLKLKTSYKYFYGSLGGFSSDIGEYGTRLTYDPKCELNYFSKTYALSNCAGFKGASGGPVVLSVSDDDIRYSYYFVGVVSHFKNKNFKNIYFSPHHIFYKELEFYINKYNTD
ncbi:MAG: trypsin-like serine protease [Campylobacterota bacterium]|nr:trypsin-like serine protease [Campylobacterota bacterium]